MVCRHWLHPRIRSIKHSSISWRRRNGTNMQGLMLWWRLIKQMRYPVRWPQVKPIASKRVWGHHREMTQQWGRNTQLQDGQRMLTRSYLKKILILRESLIRALTIGSLLRTSVLLRRGLVKVTRWKVRLNTWNEKILPLTPKITKKLNFSHIFTKHRCY